MHYQKSEGIFGRILRSKITIITALCVVAIGLISVLLFANAKSFTLFDGAVSKTFSNNKASSAASSKAASSENYAGQTSKSASFEVKLTVYGTAKTVTFTKGTVKELLAQENITLKENDVVEPTVSTVIKEKCAVVINNVVTTTETKKEAIPYTTTYENDDSMNEGESYVKVEGKNGEVENTYTTRTVNGVKGEPVITNKNIITAVTNEVIVKGTKIASSESIEEIATENYSVETYAEDTANYSHYEPVYGSGATTYNNSCLSTVSPLTPEWDFELDANGRPVNYQFCISGSASAYTAYEGAHTATGAVAQAGYIAVDPDIIPYHSHLYIITSDGSIVYGYARAEDTGGFIYWGTRVGDLYFNTYDECINWGVRDIEIFVL